MWLGSAESARRHRPRVRGRGRQISVADGWQHGPSVDKGARWEPAEVGPGRARAARARRPRPRRCTARNEPRAPGAARGAGASGARIGVWTDETLLDRLGARRRRHARDRRRRRAPDGRRPPRAVGARSRPRCASAACGPATSSCGSCRTGGKRVVLCWAVWRCGAIASPITPTPARARGRLHPRQTGARARRRAARRSAAPTTRRCSRDAGFDGDGDRGARRRARCPTSAAPPPAVDVDVDDAAVILWTSGTTSEPKGVVHTHQSLRVEADTIAAAHDMRAGEALLLPMPITHVAGLTYGVLLPVTSAITAVLMDTWEPGRALELVEREHDRGDDQHAGVHAHDDRSPRRSRRPTRTSVRLFSLGGAGVAPAMVREGARAFGCWCKRTYGSTEYPTLTTGRLGDDPERDATTDGAADRRGRAAHRRPRDARRRARPARRASCSRAARRCSSATSTPRSTPTSFVDGGWFRTGDLARLRRRVPHDRRPAEGHHHPRRREHLRAGGRGAARDASRRSPKPRASPCPIR